ncbi:MAG: DNA alkylation repair protein [Pontibacterium sp.]
MADALKDVYTSEFIERLAVLVKTQYATFEQASFISDVFDDEWEGRELKARMYHIRSCLHKYLPNNYAQALAILRQSATAFGGFEAMFFPDFVEAYGQDDWDNSISALEWFTQYSSSEFAVRPFIKANTARMMAVMYQWAKHENEHVRRLASEGSRPRLPWAMALPSFKKDPTPIWPILDALRNDPSEYVRRSVANNLNDISKDHPSLVLDWAERHFNETQNTDRLIKHALRGLLKQAHPRALHLFGYADVSGSIQGTLNLDQPTVRVGDILAFNMQATCDHAQPLGKLRVEYLIDYQKANGKISQKAFSWRELDCDSSTLTMAGKQSFKQMTTRKHYEGEHVIRLRINGCELAQQRFMVQSV